MASQPTTLHLVLSSRSTSFHWFRNNYYLNLVAQEHETEADNLHKVTLQVADPASESWVLVSVCDRAPETSPLGITATRTRRPVGWFTVASGTQRAEGCSEQHHADSGEPPGTGINVCTNCPTSIRLCPGCGGDSVHNIDTAHPGGKMTAKPVSDSSQAGMSVKQRTEEVPCLLQARA